MMHFKQRQLLSWGFYFASIYLHCCDVTTVELFLYPSANAVQHIEQYSSTDSITTKPMSLRLLRMRVCVCLLSSATSPLPAIVREIIWKNSYHLSFELAFAWSHGPARSVCLWCLTWPGGRAGPFGLDLPSILLCVCDGVRDKGRGDAPNSKCSAFEPLNESPVPKPRIILG